MRRALGFFLAPLAVMEARHSHSSFHDAMTTASVKVALAFKPGVRVTDVETHDGTVTLTGDVRTEAEGQLATKVAEDVDGVHEVVHHIHVRG
jgi:hyperosmotically inducible periplasmic protein